MFRREFVPLILDGTKGLTIRKKARLKPGERFAMRYWSGAPYRSKQVEFATATAWIVEPIKISMLRIESPRGELSRRFIARKDGFKGWAAMRSFFNQTHGLPFEGWMHNWEELTPTVKEVA